MYVILYSGEKGETGESRGSKEKNGKTHHRLTFKKMLHSIFINKDFSQRGVSDTIS